MRGKSEELTDGSGYSPVVQQHNTLGQKVLLLPIAEIHQRGEFPEAVCNRMKPTVQHINFLNLPRWALKK